VLFQQQEIFIDTELCCITVKLKFLYSKYTLA